MGIYMEIIANNIDKKGKIRKSKKILPGKCVFPFTYKGVSHNNCVEGDSGDWCATSLTDRGSVKTWGYCQNMIEKKKSSKKSSSELSSKKSSKNPVIRNLIIY